LDTYNLNTKRAIIEENGHMEWVWGNMWSGKTMLYPCSILKWDNASCEHLWVAFANTGQNQDTGAKVIHIWKNTSSNVVSKSLSKWWGISTFRGLVDIKAGALSSTAKTDCAGLIIDDISVNNAIPTIKVWNTSSVVAHEASAWKINETDLFYLMSRWISREEAVAMIVNGFLSGVIKELPLEYASEMNVLIWMEFEGGF
jgi:Fe-S cluster assembly protein SufB